MLEVLAHSAKPLSGRTVHRLVHPPASPQGVQNALDELARSGLVIQERVGRAVVNTLNREHILAPLIQEAARLREVVLRKVTDIVQQEAPRATSAVLFGSVARGDDTNESDIDLLIVWPDEVCVDERDVTELSERVRALTGNACEPFSMSETEFAQIDVVASELATRLRADGISLLNDDL